MPLGGRGASGWGGKDWEWGASGAATALNEDVMAAGTGCWLGGEIHVVRLGVRSGDRDSIKVVFCCCCYFIFLAAWQGMWNLGSPTRDQTCTLCAGSRVFLTADPSLPPTSHPRNFPKFFFFNNILNDFFFKFIFD